MAVAAPPDEYAEFEPVTAAPATAPADEYAGFDQVAPAPTKEADPNTLDDLSDASVAPDVLRATLGGAADLASLPFRAAGVVGRNIYHSVVDPMPAGPQLSVPDAPAAVTPEPAYEPQLSDFIHPERWKEAAHYFADEKLGTKPPDTPAKQTAAAVDESTPAALLMGPEGSGAKMLGSLALNDVGTAASDKVRQAGGSPLAQAAAGIAAGSGLGLAGTVGGAGVRGALRGTSGAATQEAVDQAAKQGITLSAGEATGNKTVQKLEATSGALWGGGPIEAHADDIRDKLRAHVEDLADNLSGNRSLEKEDVGNDVNEGLKTSFKDMRNQEEAAYDALNAKMPAASIADVSNTLRAYEKHAGVIRGAEYFGGGLVPPDIAKDRQNLLTDISNNAQLHGPLRSSQLPYSALAQARSRLGNSIDWGPLPSNPGENGIRKQIYGAMTEDLNNAASTGGFKAESDAAKALYTANSAARDSVSRVIDKAGGPEAVYNAALSGTKQGSTQISAVMNQLKPDDQNLLRAAVIKKMGTPTGSTQRGPGDTFDPNTFLTNWSEKNFSTPAKNALFGTSGTPGTVRSSLDDLSKTLYTLRNSRALKNPSGSGGLIAHSGGLAMVGAAAIERLFQGEPGQAAALAGGGAATAVLNNVAARWLTNPKTAQWLASTAKLPASGLANAANQLISYGEKKNDPDAVALAQQFKKSTASLKTAAP